MKVIVIFIIETFLVFIF